MKILIHLIVVALALLLVARVVPGILVADIYVALLVALVLGLLNAIVRPILVILTLPITILTFGLFIFVLNALIFWFVGSIIPGFAVEGFIPALLGSVIVSVASMIAHKLVR